MWQKDQPDYIAKLRSLPNMQFSESTEGEDFDLNGYIAGLDPSIASNANERRTL